jgi:cyanobactin maturation PatA/PatG family protease
MTDEHGDPCRTVSPAPPPHERVEGLAELRAAVDGGHPDVVVAVLDGHVDATHPALAGARLFEAGGAPLTSAASGTTADHGTMVASVMAGRPGSAVEGVAPGCTYVIVPVFTAAQPQPSQLELARGIEVAVQAGAHVINLSGGQYQDSPFAHDLLERAVRWCEERDVLLVAAAGNDGCDCAHVPAALPGVLAVGSTGPATASEFSNWGEHYAGHGLTAPGEQVAGAVCGGSVATASGTSLAAPVVAAAAALLLSVQARDGRPLTPRRVGQLLLDHAVDCAPAPSLHCRRLLGRTLNLKGTLEAMSNLTDFAPDEDPGHAAPAGGAHQSCSCGAAAAAPPQQPVSVAPSPFPSARPSAPAGPFGAVASAPVAAASGGGAVQSIDPVVADGQLVYALAGLGFDFGNEARRDSFKQMMAPAVFNGQPVPPNPYDARQLVEHLQRSPAEARALIWTLNLELSPIYAIEPVGPYARDVYDILTRVLGAMTMPAASDGYVERISIPGRLTGRSVRLFSGQVVPVVEVDNTRGIYAWEVNRLINAALDGAGIEGERRLAIAGNIRSFLDHIYYELRNLGRLSRDRAMNFAATNAFQAAQAFAAALYADMEFDRIELVESPYARFDADAWDVKLKFFDPENLQRARKVFRFTVDVSEVIPVTLGEVRSWSASS